VVTIGFVSIGINDELEKVIFGQIPDYAYVSSDISIIAINFKTNSIKQIPPREEAIGPASITTDLVILSDGVWLHPNILSFTFHQEICQNPEADMNQVERIYKALPEKTCTYNFDTGEVQIKESIPGSSSQSIKSTGTAKDQKKPGQQNATPKTIKSKKKQKAKMS
jgi:hypothetical protein